jgi:hypothetical protein
MCRFSEDGKSIICFEGPYRPIVDESGRVISHVVAIEGTDQVLCVFENADPVEMTEDDFRKWQIRLRMALRN